MKGLGSLAGGGEVWGETAGAHVCSALAAHMSALTQMLHLGYWSFKSICLQMHSDWHPLPAPAILA